MKRLLPYIACVIALAFSGHAAHAQNTEACRSVQFSPEILDRFPSARDACLDVITRGGQQYAVFRAQFDRAVGRTLHVRFTNADGSRGPATAVPTDANFRVLVDGEARRVGELARNQELTAYVQVSRPMIALAPAAVEDDLQPVPFVVISPSEQAASEEPNRVAAEAPAMPSTAGAAPTLGAIGLLLTTLGTVVAVLRRMRAARYERLRRL